eukprot:120338-Pleurochrysis_carterae.AAC.1
MHESDVCLPRAGWRESPAANSAHVTGSPNGVRIQSIGKQAGRCNSTCMSQERDQLLQWAD